MNLTARRRLTALLFFGLYLSFSIISSALASPVPDTSKATILNKIATLPVPLIEAKSGVAEYTSGYMAHTFGGTLFVAPDGNITYALVKPGGGWAISERISTAVVASASGIAPLGSVTLFIGNDPTRWQNLFSYSSISFGQISQGISASVSAYGDRIEKQFRFNPGTTVSTISIQTTGADTLAIANSGELVISSVRGTVKLAKPVAYQEENGIRTTVDCTYSTTGATYGFMADTYDATKELIITVSLQLEPVGGLANGEPLSVALDENGNIVVAGSSGPLTTPITSGPFDIATTGLKALFVSKYGAALDTYPSLALIGGTGTDRATALDVASNGSIFLSGNTFSADFPTTTGALSTINHGAGDAFVAKLDSSLHTLHAATLLGGSAFDEAKSLSLNADGSVVVNGTTTSSDFPGIIKVGLDQSTSVTFAITLDSSLSSLLTSGFVVTPTAVQKPSATSTATSSATSSTETSTESGILTTQIPEIPGTATEASAVDNPGWFMGTANPISPDQAEAYYASLKGSTPAKVLLSTQGFAPMSATAASSEITELARALRYDPKLIYDFVHNNIDYVPYFGSTKGATLTFLDGSGNDFDQASLMIALLRASNFTAQYVYGKMTIPGTNVANWLGVDVQYQAVGNVIASGGIPVSMYSDAMALMDRVWVKATIGGIDYLFDPAFKTYTYSSKVDLPTAMGYNQADFLTGATTGATVGTDYVQNLNEGNIRNKLTTYANNLIAAIRNQHANKSVEEIVGGRSIVQSYLTQYTTTLPFTPTITYTWDDIPATHATTIRIQHSGIDYIINTPDLSGKRLTLTYAGADYHPELRLDGNLLISGTATTLGSNNNCTVTINHPYAANGGTYQDQTVTYTPESGKNYAIVYNFGGVSDTLLQKRQQQLDVYRAQGLADATEAVLGETLHLMGMTWLKETTQSTRLLSAVAETVPIIHHNVGFMCQEAGYYIDVKAGAGSILSRHNVEADKAAHFKLYSLIGSAFEHGILEQLAGSDKPGVSTMKLFQIANATAQKVFLTTSTNFAAVKPQLINYTASELTDFQNQVNSSRVLILPANGQLILNQWKGKGYISKYFSGSSMSMGMIIGGNYFGGYAATPGTISTPTVIQYTQTAQVTTPAPATASLNITTVPPSTSKDPVDMAGGSFLVDRTDLALGGAAPLGLAFSRSYTSADAMSKRSMGYGWSHNYDVYLTPTSHGEPGLGLRQPIDAAAMIAALYVGYDLLKNYDDVTAWISSSLASKWAIDQVIDNAMVVHLGKKVMEFIKLPDGSYASPPGITTKLIKNGDGTFSLVERFGGRINFNSSKQASQIIDVDGNILSLIYNGDKLETVRDAYNRTLTLGYNATSGRLETVTDSTNRIAKYSYDANGDLTTYTDPELKDWGYGYNSHRLTTLTNPLLIITATNVYDTLGRVMSQTVPRQGIPGTTATYNFYFSDFRNTEEDPAGHATTYYYDRKGREFAVENALGQKSVKQFDGQNHPVIVTNPRQYSTIYEYDGNLNLFKTTNALNYETTNQYDTQFRLTDIFDHLQHNTHFGYDSRHNLTLTRDNLGNTSTATYNGSKGKKDTATDGRSIVTAFTYDGFGNPDTTKTAAHPVINFDYDPIGRMTDLTDQESSRTSFEYDKRSLLKKITDSSRTRYTILDYNADGSLWTKTDRNNNTITYSYTPSGKLDTISSPGRPSVVHTYNLLDQLINMQDSIGTTIYGYNAAGRLESTTNPHGFTIGYSYDAAGNLTELTYPGNKKVIYTYDELNRLRTVTIDWLTGKPVATYNYKPQETDILDNLVQFNGITTAYTFDTAHRLTGMTSPVASYSFTELDGNGNRKGLTQTEPLAFTYSPNIILYGYNDQKNRLMSAGSASFGYDNEGQLTSGYGGGFTFDHEHRLTGAGGTTYAYDGTGNRLQATSGGTTTRYIYDAGGNLLAEADGGNTIIRYYIHGAGLLAMVTPTDQVYNYHYNATGSTVAMTDQSQTMVNKYAYDPFGNIGNQEESIPQPFKYVGQFGVMTEPNGFYYMKARYYDPNVGRFISEDPTGFDGGDVNLMAYVGNQPVNGIDPSGLWTMSLSVNLSGALATIGATGGTNFNIGHDSRSDILHGWSASITGTAGGGVSLGFGGGLGFNATVTNANNVNQLQGTSAEVGVGYGPVSVGTVIGSNYTGGSVSIVPTLWRTPTGAVPGYLQQTSTSAIIQSSTRK